MTNENSTNRTLLYATSFLVGVAILVIEILGFRVFAPYFGTSVYVTGSMIGVIIGSLSIGYYFGGTMADKYPTDKYIYFIILLGGAYLSVMFLFYKVILSAFTGFGLLVGTLLATLVIFIPPMVLLSMVTPYVVKLVSRQETLGTDAGRVFAISTVGSVLGSFLTTFYLLPTFGSNFSILLGVVSLYAIAVLGLLRHSIYYSLLGLGVLVLFIPQSFPGDDKKTGKLVYEEESHYSLIRIYDANGLRIMNFNNSKGRQSYQPKPELIGSRSHPASYREFFNLAPFLNPIEHMSSEHPYRTLILGMSAGASVHELTYFYSKAIDIDAVEIDPAVVRLSKQYFDVREADNIQIYTEDARTFVSRPGQKQYDFVEIDLFQGGPEIPFYTVTEEFFGLVADRMSGKGMVMMNMLGTAADNNQLLVPVADTMSKVFPSIYFIEVGVNTLIIAYQENLHLPEIVQRLQGVDHRQLTAFKSYALNNISGYISDKPVNGHLVFTDDKAPVETLNYQVYKNILENIEGKGKHVL